MSFYRERLVSKTKKRQFCAGCQKRIDAGSVALYCSGKQDDFWSAYYNQECREAEIEMNNLIGSYGDEWTSVGDADEVDMKDWLKEAYPNVHERRYGTHQ